MIDYITINQNLCIARNRKAASTTLCRAALANTNFNIDRPAGVEEPTNWHAKVAPLLSRAPAAVVLLLVREPEDRFLAGCAKIGVTNVNTLLKFMEDNPESEWDKHFFRQSSYASGLTKLYKFDGDIDALGAAAGFPTPLPVEVSPNPPKADRPTLTSAQRKRVLALYKDDVTLYESITMPGQVWQRPLTVSQQAYAAAAAAFNSLSPGKQALWEPVRVKVAEKLVEGDLAGAKAILETVPALYDGAEDDRAMFLALFP